MRRKGGFTLVEMVVSIICASLIVMAGMAVVTVSMRVQGEAVGRASEQNTARVVLTMIENMAAGGSLKPPEFESENSVVLRTTSNTETITYKDGNISVGGVVLLEDAELSVMVNGQLLTAAVTDADGETYTTSVLCRSWPKGAEDPDIYAVIGEIESSAEISRVELLKKLETQLGSTGKIKGSTDKYEYYSEWYHSGFSDGWNKSTPWCTCFVFWCLEHSETKPSNMPSSTSNVSELWKKLETSKTAVTEAKAGDLIFFNFNGDPEADHVGFVLKVDEEKNWVYTLEGNRNGAVTQYHYELKIDEESNPQINPKILGCYQLKWAGGTTP